MSNGNSSGAITCPHCGATLAGSAGTIRDKPATCPSCGASFDSGEKRRDTSEACPSCGHALKKGNVICVNCGYNVRSGAHLETKTRRASGGASIRPIARPVSQSSFAAKVGSVLRGLLTVAVLAGLAFGIKVLMSEMDTGFGAPGFGNRNWRVTEARRASWAPIPEGDNTVTLVQGNFLQLDLEFKEGGSDVSAEDFQVVNADDADAGNAFGSIRSDEKFVLIFEKGLGSGIHMAAETWDPSQEYWLEGPGGRCRIPTLPEPD